MYSNPKPNNSRFARWKYVWEIVNKITIQVIWLWITIFIIKNKITDINTWRSFFNQMLYFPNTGIKM